MSDINQTITESIDRAFNAGKELGKLTERQRILELAKSIAHHEHLDMEWLAYNDLEEMANEE